MPTYRFYNSKTKTEFEEYMTISDMEKFTKKKHIELLPPTQMNIVSSVGQIDSKTQSQSERKNINNSRKATAPTVGIS